jgi:CBS domain-containing protein
MYVADLMRKHPRTLGPETTIQTAARMMRDEDLDVLPIVDHMGALVGIVTEHNIVTDAIADGGGAATPVGKCMTRDPETVARDTTIEQAMMLMSTHQVPCLPVMENGRLVGMLTLADIAANVYLDDEEFEDDEAEDLRLERPIIPSYDTR